MVTEHEILIPNTLLAIYMPYRMLSPQHWVQHIKNPDGTYCIIKHSKMIINWHGGTLTGQVELDKNNNSGFIRTSLSYRKYNNVATAMNT